MPTERTFHPLIKILVDIGSVPLFVANDLLKMNHEDQLKVATKYLQFIHQQDQILGAEVR